MGQVSPVLRRFEGGYAHWCPGCDQMHLITTDAGRGPQWSFDGNVDCPTFSPSVRVTYNGPDAGQDRGHGHAPSSCCHYFVTGGQIQFCPDSTHALAGQTVPVPELPDWLRDEPRTFDCEIMEHACADDSMGGGAVFAEHIHEICDAKHT